MNKRRRKKLSNALWQKWRLEILMTGHLGMARGSLVVTNAFPPDAGILYADLVEESRAAYERTYRWVDPVFKGPPLTVYAPYIPQQVIDEMEADKNGSATF